MYIIQVKYNIISHIHNNERKKTKEKEIYKFDIYSLVVFFLKCFKTSKFKLFFFDTLIIRSQRQDYLYREENNVVILSPTSKLIKKWLGYDII